MKSQFVPTPPEELQFKRTADGWVYTMASPWLFAPRRSYLVSEQVKPLLAQRVRQAQSVQVWILVPLIVLLGTVVSFYPQLLKQASALQWFGYAIFLAATVGLTIVFANYFCVRSIVNDLPRTKHGVPYAENFTRFGEMMSTKALAISVVLFGLLSALRIYQLMTSRAADGMTRVSAIMAGGAAIVSLAMLVQRLRAGRKQKV
jgi:hypothetical protein